MYVVGLRIPDMALCFFCMYMYIRCWSPGGSTGVGIKNAEREMEWNAEWNVE